MTLVEVLIRASPMVQEADAKKWATPILSAAQEFELYTANRFGMFLAHSLWETGFLKLMTEPEEKAAAYNTRKDLHGNWMGHFENIGVLFRGRGGLHITGAVNYERFGDRFGVNFLLNPELVATPEWAYRVGGAYWQEHGLNALADTGDLEDFRMQTHIINGAATDEGPSFHARRFGLLTHLWAALGTTGGVVLHSLA